MASQNLSGRRIHKSARDIQHTCTDLMADKGLQADSSVMHLTAYAPRVLEFIVD
jgi:hypothetical protein